MKQNYLLRIFIILNIFTLGLTSCAEKEDVVSPKETCGTMATVQYQQGTGLNLVLENGQFLQPENVKQVSAEKQVFAIDGFVVKAGQKILIGYKPAAVSKTATGKTIKVNCIVGLSPQ
jgi:hypothetical protein